MFFGLPYVDMVCAVGKLFSMAFFQSNPDHRKWLCIMSMAAFINFTFGYHRI